ncbi:hypothetical protein B484DRAFT_429324 [Ochromonadaceae sp. CCMP2298]|nr:hypothetical protein B484DRAFT_429324 [Ochromonadaceae sp. CCMP2298]
MSVEERREQVMSVEERREQPVCGKCGKCTRKKPPGTWPTGWGCDSAEHQGSNEFTDEDCVWGCPTVAYLSEQIAQAAKRGSKPWGRSKIMIVGEGRAGKSALANSIIGRPFSQTESTVGINQLTCDIKYAAVGGGEWGEFVKPEREFEAALAQLLVAQRSNRLSLSAAVSMDEQVDDRVAAPEHKQPQKPASGPPKGENETPKSDGGGGDGGVGRKAVALPEVDNELVAKCLSEGIQTESKLILSVFDYGGQSVFNVIHHFFLTRYGVYLLVFNMEWLLGDAVQQRACLDYLRFWLNSVVIHTLNNKGETAPVAFVGTRKDTVSDPKQHGRISALLYTAFSSSVAWPYVLENDQGVGSNGCTTLCFYAVDNTLGRGDPTTKQLLTHVERVISEAAYVKEEKPLVWLQVLDRLAAEKKSFLTLAEVEQAAAVCGMGKEELPALLRFLHEMGALMWHEDEALRDVVILDAVTYFVQPATLVICKHAPTATDPTLHLLPQHKKCRKALPAEFRNMTEKGIVTGQLLQMLLGGEAGRIVTLMVKFGLLVPMQGEEEEGGAGGAGGAGGVGGAGGAGDLDPAQEYLVPALLPCCDSTGPWTSTPHCTCYVVLTASSSLHKLTPLCDKDLHSEGFLPRGLVERLIGKAVMWCQVSGLCGIYGIWHGICDM